MIKKIVTFIWTLLGCAAGYGVFLAGSYFAGLRGLKASDLGLNAVKVYIIIAICISVCGLIFFKMTPFMERQLKKAGATLESQFKGISGADILIGTAGLIAGLVIATLLTHIYETFRIPWLTSILTIITYLIFGYLGIVLALKKGPDVVSTINMSFANKKMQIVSGRFRNRAGDAMPKIFDTSVIIDGRIADVMKTGFIEGRIIIPEFVLVELRHIADSSDSLKRQRGRRGLDILNRIQNEYGIEIYNSSGEKALEEIPEVDIKLLKLAQIIGGKVVTNDFNLNKVASIKGVEVLNINDLANTLKPVVLPGETMQLFLVKEGKEHDQALAYLDDGTMIVVEDARKYIGQTIDVLVKSVLQTSAGRMIFGRPKK